LEKTKVIFMYTFELELHKESSTLSLLKDGVVVKEKSWPEGRDMGRKLFVSIAELLKEQGIKAEEVSDFLVESELPEVYTSTRIAETVKKVYAFGVRAKINNKR
jgi:tRNA A37 threonylcarbamoyladenosine modification protein TsaB